MTHRSASRCYLLSGVREASLAPNLPLATVLPLHAVLKLGNAGDSDPATAAGLAAALQDPDALVRRDAIRAVAKLKQPGRLIKERLQTMTRRDQDSLARDLASKALERLGGAE